MRGATLSGTERERLRQAIARAERQTAAEIVCVVARRSGSHFFPALAVALLCLVGASLVVAVALDRLWSSLSLPLFALAQALAALALVLALRLLPQLSLFLAPPAVRFRAAREEARRQFLARDIHRTRGRTGVLVFVSLAERTAAVLADEGIDRLVEPGTWDRVVAALVARARGGRLAEGLEEAIKNIGALLAQHVPPGASEINELPDHLVEL